MLIQLDPSVVKRAQRGDEKAFSVIVRTYHLPIFNYVLRSVGDRELAEDLTQEVFLRVWKALPRYAFRAKLTTWIFQVAKNVVLDDIRSRKNRLQPVELVPELSPAAPGAADRAGRDHPGALGRDRAAERRPQDRAAAARCRGHVVQRDRRRARHPSGHGQVADLQRTQRGPGRPRRGAASRSSRPTIRSPTTA